MKNIEDRRVAVAWIFCGSMLLVVVVLVLVDDGFLVGGGDLRQL